VLSFVFVFVPFTYKLVMLSDVQFFLAEMRQPSSFATRNQLPVLYFEVIYTVSHDRESSIDNLYFSPTRFGAF
jgi:hypothetical protein